MIYHGNKQVEEQRTPTPLHLRLHRTTPLESPPRADDESEIVRAQLTVGRRRVAVGEARGGQDGAALHAGGQPLLFER